MILKYKEGVEKRIAKACSKNRELDKALSRKIAAILENPEHFKPLRYELSGKRRVHILKSFILAYIFNKDKGIVEIVDFDHHDWAYKR